MERRVIIVDMDGTISDSSWRNELAPSNGGSWAQFHDNCHLDKPITIIEAVNILSEWFDIIISTARPSYILPKTEAWLLSNARFEVKKIYMREDHQYELSSAELKALHLDDMKARGFDIFIAIDDREDVCEMYRLKGVNAWQVFPSDVDDEKTINEKRIIAGLRPITPDDPNDILAPDAFEKENPNVVDMLLESARTFDERNREYGDSYKEYGKLLFSLFPGGVILKTESDFNRWGVFNMILAKIQRYSLNFLKGGHDDSLRDLSVYSAMQRELDNLKKEE